MPEDRVKTGIYGPFRGLFGAFVVAIGLLGVFLAFRSIRDAKTEVLLRSYGEASDEDRGRIAQALAADGDLGIARVLEMAARHEELRSLVPDLLGRMPREALGEETRMAGLAMLRTGDPEEIHTAVEVMAVMGEAAVPDVEALLWEAPSEAVAQGCLDALLRAGERGRAAVVAYYVGYFQHSERTIRRDAAVKLAEMGPAATPQLLEALGDPVVMVRLFVASSLGLIRDDRAIQALIAALRKESDLGVKVALGSTLSGITGEARLGHDADGWQAYFETYREALPAQILPPWVE